MNKFGYPEVQLAQLKKIAGRTGRNENGVCIKSRERSGRKIISAKGERDAQIIMSEGLTESV